MFIEFQNIHQHNLLQMKNDIEKSLPKSKWIRLIDFNGISSSQEFSGEARIDSNRRLIWMTEQAMEYGEEWRGEAWMSSANLTYRHCNSIRLYLSLLISVSMQCIFILNAILIRSPATRDIVVF